MSVRHGFLLTRIWGRRGRIDGTRELVAPSLPFIIVYRVLDQRVEVLRIIHGRRDWDTAYRDDS